MGATFDHAVRATLPAFLPSEVRDGFAAAIGDAELVLLQSAPRTIGHVIGGPDAIVQALVEALGPQRTVMVPTFTTALTDPSGWTRPAAPQERWDEIRRELPLYDPRRSSPRKMGRIADLLWRLPDAKRSAHPVESIAALGPLAGELTYAHPIDDPMGPRGPWARLVSLDARVLLLGVGLERCSLLHHCERMADVPYQALAGYAVPVDIDGERRWIEVEESGGNCSDGFPKLVPALEAKGAFGRVSIGQAETLVLSARTLFEVATAALARDAAALLCDDESCPLCPAARVAVREKAASR
jgi:aminoglycoside 3-N-acetyltransferase